jgi:hypothetical protein
MRTTALLASIVSALFAGAPAYSGDVPASCGDPTHSCFEVALDKKGCANPECCQTTCSIEPYCCDVAWDELCVAIAVKFCSPCGTSANSCFSANGTPGCAESNCCSYVCSLPGFGDCCVIAWDEDCAAKAAEVCQGCGAPGAGSCRVVHEGFGCDDSTCCTLVCAVDPTCCQTTWDQTCVEWAAFFCPGCGDSNTGNCCVPRVTPFCDDADCCELVCDVDSFCCDVRWDINCVEQASNLCGLTACTCGDPAAGSCKAVKTTPGCSDLDCCGSVCLFDEFCCVVAWDKACTLAADALCSDIDVCGVVGSGSCFVRHPTPGCDDAGCCQTVCEIDPLCCKLQWDQNCADLAQEICADCGVITTGSCFEVDGTPSCSNAQCCQLVCATDPFCCQDSWDSVCVTFAEALCAAPIEACGTNQSRSCFIPSAYLAGCDDAGCCVQVCTTLDPFCCEVQWDAVCVELAFSLCGGNAACPGRGSCLVPHPFPGCNEAICCTAVCAIDNTCCLLGWDQSCADIAQAVCFGQSACPGTDPCTTSHGTPGCEDPSCCNVVCAVDPLCCIEKWDLNCVAIAADRCQPEPDSNCPCIGSCFDVHANAGCDDASCCAGVCAIDPACCSLSWDGECVGLARIVCCGAVGCGNFCAGSCFEPHPQPFCNDAACCAAVCDVDPFCCITNWDSFCAAAADERCTVLCGVPDSGSCFVPRERPSCEDRECCDAVCAVDPVCCTIAWDGTCVDLAQGNPRRKALCAEPECGTFFAGDCCSPHDNPTCDDAACCEAVCAEDPFCCDSEWDATCAGIARENSACNCVSECGDPCAGSCCEPRETPLCDDEACCSAVCAIDPFCCELAGGSWDNLCVGIALTQEPCDDPCPVPGCGDPAAGGCCAAKLTPNCDDATCCEAVCKLDSFCCDVSWDITCATLAGLECKLCQSELFCGSPDAGNCLVANNTPFCDDFGCCSLICVIDDTCCTVQWDESCAKLAQGLCSGF